MQPIWLGMKVTPFLWTLSKKQLLHQGNCPIKWTPRSRDDVACQKIQSQPIWLGKKVTPFSWTLSKQQLRHQENCPIKQPPRSCDNIAHQKKRKKGGACTQRTPVTTYSTIKTTILWNSIEKGLTYLFFSLWRRLPLSSTMVTSSWKMLCLLLWFFEVSNTLITTKKCLFWCLCKKRFFLTPLQEKIFCATARKYLFCQ